ncbi:hypothetical protein [Rhodoferax sp.]|uniref:hypothetical protein n=1 Tax=Rhodoferax sp. TaxID=50421 RepID=UPI00260B9080|nr:hypothetical protein [Rhodoferax sp.]MDD5480582.1 hypothetical protein [Rhodoferax sp.]
MATQKRTTRLLSGSATHTRTERDYMAVLLDEVDTDTWREVIKATVQEAKGGNAQARAWLGQYLIGQPGNRAPTAVNVIVGQLQGKDKVLDTLVQDTYMQATFPDTNAADKASIRAQLATELHEKLQQADAT